VERSGGGAGPKIEWAGAERDLKKYGGAGAGAGGRVSGSGAVSGGYRKRCDCERKFPPLPLRSHALNKTTILHYRPWPRHLCSSLHHCQRRWRCLRALAATLRVNSLSWSYFSLKYRTQFCRTSPQSLDRTLTRRRPAYLGYYHWPCSLFEVLGRLHTAVLAVKSLVLVSWPWLHHCFVFGLCMPIGPLAFYWKEPSTNSRTIKTKNDETVLTYDKCTFFLIACV